jgi:hypothetical protein
MNTVRAESKLDPMEVSIQQAAMTLGILPSVLIRRIEKGELTGRKQGRIWYVELPEKERASAHQFSIG